MDTLQPTEPAMRRYLAELASHLQNAPRPIAEQGLTDAEEFLQSECEALAEIGVQPTEADMYRHFVERFGPPREVAADYATTLVDERVDAELIPVDELAATAPVPGETMRVRRVRGAVLVAIAGVVGVVSLIALSLPRTDASAQPRGYPHSAIDPAVWADRVVSFRHGGAVDVALPSPSVALGPCDCRDGRDHAGCAISLGEGGELVVEFTDNRLRDWPGFDLEIFEVGYTEPIRVAVSNDLKHWVDLGLTQGRPAMIDLAPFKLPEETYRYVRLIDAHAGRSKSGADIDAVAANRVARRD